MSLKYLDMENQIYPTLGIDIYQSSIGKDRDIITLDFTVKQKEVAEDLVSWLERGYDWIIDADTSPGEISKAKYLVFVEINRRSSAPKRIVEMLSDLKTLTGIKTDDWRIKIKSLLGPATVEWISEHLITDPMQYEDAQESLNEMRQLANMNSVSTYDYDSDVVAWQRNAGIK